MKKECIIALVDDDKIFQLTTSRIIKQKRPASTLQQFYNGDEAISFLKENQFKPEELPDIILLDINMPVTDGWMFLEEFQKMVSSIDKEIQIYMVSSSIAVEDMKRAKENPCVLGYITKPLREEDFLSIIN